MTDSNRMVVFPAQAYRLDTINYNIRLSLYAAGHGTLSRQSTQSALSIQQ